MNWTDDDLMAYVDGELDSARRSALEQALASDAALRDRVNTWRAQRERLAAAYHPVLDEPVPDRLAQLLAPAARAAAVVDLAAVRAARSTKRPAAPDWRQWGGLAASLVLGLALGMMVDRGGAPSNGTDSAVAMVDGRLVATGPLAQALLSQLASEPPAQATVAVQLSFVDRAGAYCRTFSTPALAGLACRQADLWAVQQVVAASEPASGSAMRQAATALPREVLDVVDRRVAGAVLNAAAERQARDAGWQR
ncbi:MAG: hypothetical protein ABI574_05485 [Burkholderiales bacterium]